SSGGGGPAAFRRRPGLCPAGGRARVFRPGAPDQRLQIYFGIHAGGFSEDAVRFLFKLRCLPQPQFSRAAPIGLLCRFSIWKGVLACDAAGAERRNKGSPGRKAGVWMGMENKAQRADTRIKVFHVSALWASNVSLEGYPGLTAGAAEMPGLRPWI